MVRDSVEEAAKGFAVYNKTELVKHVICVQDTLCSNKVDVEAPEEEEEEEVPLLLEGARNTPSSAREGGPPPP